jgi:hypothetical protein
LFVFVVVIVLARGALNRCYHVIEHDPAFAIRCLTFDQTKLVHGGFSAAHSAYLYAYFDIY